MSVRCRCLTCRGHLLRFRSRLRCLPVLSRVSCRRRSFQRPPTILLTFLIVPSYAVKRRKKNMIEELQRSVIFFSRANSTLKQQNDELTRLLIQAQVQVNAIESGQPAPAPMTPQSEQQQQEAVAQVHGDQQHAQAVAQQAVYETQGFSSTAARTAAQTMNAGGSETASTASGGAPVTTSAASSQQLPLMQTGATMQAMANFQQAAAVSDFCLKDTY